MELGIVLPGLGSRVVKVPFSCPCCRSEYVIEFDIDRAKHQILESGNATFQEMITVIAAYKKIKGYDRIPTWDSVHRPRALAASKKLLRFFKKTAAPVEIAIECIEDSYEQARRQGWLEMFTLETVVKRAPDWILDKQKRRG